MKLPTLSAGQLRRAAEIKDQIEALDREYLRILGVGIPEIKPKLKPRPKLSKAKRALLSRQTTARWAKRKAEGKNKL